jgi:mannose-1-phosphate guanylyltransferase
MTDLSEWPAIVLTAGLATRLRPLSLVRAKAAMPVAGVPLVGRILSWLHDAGVRRVVLNLHHLPHTVARVIGDGREWGLDARYSWERIVLGSAGGPRRAMPIFGAERFLIVNGDTLTTCDLRALVARHERSRAAVTMAVVPGDVKRYGGAVVNDDGTIERFVRGREVDAEQLPRVRHFIGVQAAEAAAFADVADDVPSETVRTLYPALIAARRGSIAAFDSDAEFLDIGTPRDYLETAVAIAAREGRALDRGEHCSLGAGAVLERTVLWDRIRLGDGAHLSNCVVADDVAVPAGARYENSALVQTDEGLIATPL